ncbi:helix-turn-helix domain-containing protein [Paenibacillus sp. GCM10027626]|uniref:AraC family transcriptional regulator n=1 Tax=Paenibacillus sp. GCM10027626 TaxID=3273411 RepID=UPI00362B32D4
MSSYMERAEHAWTEDSLRLIITPTDFAKSSLYYVQEIGHFHAFPAYFTERSKLDSYLFVYTVSGHGRLTYKGKTYPLSAHQLFFIDCREYQHYAAQSGQTWELLWVHLHGQSTAAYYEQFAQQGGPVRTVSPDHRYQRIIHELIALHRYKRLHNELLASRLLVDLLTELLLTEEASESAAGSIPPYIAELLHFIEQHCHQKWSLEQFSKLVAVNKYHLAKQFKKYTGLSPGEYMINARITRAKELLKYSGVPVAEIAERIGIDNVSHFINLFKARTGQTPLAFRRTWQSK